MREGEQSALQAAVAAGYVGASETLAATEGHYNFFESLISGRDMNSDVPPSDRFRKMFPAQANADANRSSVATVTVTPNADADTEARC
eukprot:586123-Prymnesium_polylepis.2